MHSGRCLVVPLVLAAISLRKTCTGDAWRVTPGRRSAGLTECLLTPQKKDSARLFNRYVQNSRFELGRWAISMRYLDGQVFIELAAAARTNAGTKTKKGYYEGRILRILQVLPFGSFSQPSFSDDFNTKSGSHSSHLNGRALIPKVSLLGHKPRSTSSRTSAANRFLSSENR
jgi:hypothetical protein